MVHLFEKGRRRRKGVILQPGLSGHLVCERNDGRWELSLRHGIGSRYALTLIEPRFAGVTMHGLYLDGVEIVDDVEYRQGWLIKDLRSRVDRDEPNGAAVIMRPA